MNHLPLLPLVIWLLVGSTGVVTKDLVKPSETRVRIQSRVKAVVYLKLSHGSYESSCTGWVSGKNQVMTASHCLAYSDIKVRAVFVDGREAPMVLLWRGGTGTNYQPDVAVLRGDTGGVKPLSIAPPGFRLPDTCFYVSYRSLEAQYTLPCVAHRVEFHPVYDDYKLKLVAEIVRGDSGGPVISRDNKVIGIVTNLGYKRFEGFAEPLSEVIKAKKIGDKR